MNKGTLWITRFLSGLMLWVYSFTGFSLTPLPADQAFSLTIERENSAILTLHWTIAPGHALYQDSIRFTTTPTSQVHIIHWPDSHAQSAHKPIYEHALGLSIMMAPPLETGHLTVQYQGCHGTLYCYPPIQKTVDLQTLQEVKPSSESTPARKSFFTSLFSFFVMGLLLAFTPCILPILPLFSGFLLHQQESLRSRRGFSLSLGYVLGMASAYALIGALAGLLGRNLQVSLQTPAMITLSTGLFILLGLSLLDCYTFQLPHALNHRVFQWKKRYTQPKHLLGAVLLGALSILVVSPCITPPLVASLSYITKTRNIWLGALDLFVAGLGIGVPLLLLSLVGERYLPKSGYWSLMIKKILGILLLGLSIELVSRFLPNNIHQILWILLCAWLLYYFRKEPKAWVLQTFLVFVTGSMLWTMHQFKEKIAFIPVVTTVEGLRQAIVAASPHPIIIDYYAKWCLACQEMEHHVLPSAEVRALLADTSEGKLGHVLIKVDISDNSPDSQALLEEYQVIAPPTWIFLDAQGEEIPGTRLMGSVKKRAFINYLKEVGH